MEYRSAAAFSDSTWVATREQVEAELARLRAANERLRAVCAASLVYEDRIEPSEYEPPNSPKWVAFHKACDDLCAARRACDEAGDLLGAP